MMSKGNMLAVIPVRGGSKGLPGKNIRPFCGKPLLAWTIELAQQCSCIDSVVVSTDSEAIAFVSAEFGAPVPFMRPAALADDVAASADVILHALDFYESQGQFFEHVAMLQATSPLRQTSDVERAFSELRAHPGAESIVSVGAVGHQHPVHQVTIDKNGFMRPLTGLSNGVIPVIRRQDIETQHYFFDGNIYISKTSTFKTLRSFSHAKTIPFVDEKIKTIDIDDELDFYIAEKLMEKYFPKRSCSLQREKR